MTAATTAPSIVDRLAHVRERLRAAGFPLATAGAAEAGSERDELIGQIDDYLLPRLLSLDAPVLTVLGGSTGAGKSTLMNSLVGRQVSVAGVLRPTTRVPVLVCHPAEVGWFSDDRILPGLARSTGGTRSEEGELHLVVDQDVVSGLALLDAPDIDSVEEANRELGSQLLAAADLWLFVTTAARYADAVPWDFLRAAQARSTSLAVVLNRVPPGAEGVVAEHLAAMLRKEGLEDAPLFVVREAQLSGGLVHEEEIAPVRRWLNGLIADAEARDGVVRTTLEGALGNLRQRVPLLATHLDEQAAAGRRLRAEVDRAYESARRSVAEPLADGRLLRGEVLSRWQYVVGTGDLMRSLESRLGWLRDRVQEVVMGRPSAVSEVATAVETSIETLVGAAADAAAERVVEAWRGLPGGGQLLTGAEGRMDRSAPAFRPALSASVRGWQAFVLELVAAEGASKRAIGRALSLGVNGLGVALMVAMFAQTGGLTGGEVVVAGGTAAVSQKLLEALFGDQAVRQLTARARADLLQRVGDLLDEEAARFRALIAAVSPAPGLAEELRTGAAALEGPVE
ncbi:dynamin family protein [soil metagenome]